MVEEFHRLQNGVVSIGRCKGIVRDTRLSQGFISMLLGLQALNEVTLLEVYGAYVIMISRSMIFYDHRYSL